MKTNSLPIKIYFLHPKLILTSPHPFFSEQIKLVFTLISSLVLTLIAPSALLTKTVGSQELLGTLCFSQIFPETQASFPSPHNPVLLTSPGTQLHILSSTSPLQLSSILLAQYSPEFFNKLICSTFLLLQAQLAKFSSIKLLQLLSTPSQISPTAGFILPL